MPIGGGVPQTKGLPVVKGFASTAPTQNQTSAPFFQNADSSYSVINAARVAATALVLTASAGLVAPLAPMPVTVVGIAVNAGDAPPRVRPVYYQARVDPIRAVVAVAATPSGWQQALSGAPPTASAVHTNYDLPSAPARTPSGWQGSLSTPPPTATAVVTSYDLPSAPMVPIVTVGVQLYAGGAPPRVRLVYHQARVEPPFYTAPVVVAAPQGWQQALSLATPTASAVHTNYDLPTAPARTPSGWQGSLSTPPPTATALHTSYDLPSAPATLPTVVVPLYAGGTAPRLRLVYHQAQVAPLYVAPVIAATPPYGWQPALSAAPPVAKAQVGFGFVPFNTVQLAVNYSNYGWFAPLSVAVKPVRFDVGQPVFVSVPAAVPQGWYQAFAAAPVGAKPQTGFALVPYDKAQVSVNFTAFGWQQAFALAPPVVQPQAGFAFVPLNTAQVSVNFTPFGWQGPIAAAPVIAKAQAGFVSPALTPASLVSGGWQQALSIAPAIRRAADVVYQVPVYPVVAAANNTVELAKWQAPLSVAVTVAKATPDFVFVPPYVTPAVVAAYTNLFLQPLSVAVPGLKFSYESWQLSYNVTVVAPPSLSWQGSLSTPPRAAVAQAGFVASPLSAPQVNTIGWQAPLASAPVPTKAQAGFSTVPYNTVQAAPVAPKQFWPQLSVAPRPAQAQVGFSYVPFNTVQRVPPVVIEVPGSGGTRKLHPTSFVPVKRKGGYTEPKLEDRVEVRRPLQPETIEPPKPIEVVVEAPPVLAGILKGVLTPERIEFESDEDAIAQAIAAYLEEENAVRETIASAATEIIETLIAEIIADLEAEGPTDNG